MLSKMVNGLLSKPLPEYSFVLNIRGIEIVLEIKAVCLNDKIWSKTLNQRWHD